MASCTALFDHVAALSTSTEFTDVVLVARAEDGTSKELPSHLCILARSPVFKRMFCGTFSESALKSVEIPVTKPKHLEIMREYMYTDKMELADDWTASDIVELMALFDKYGVTSAFSLVSEELMKHLDNLALSDAQEIVDHLSITVGQQELVHEALAKIVPKVESGSEVMQFLVWLQRFHESSGVPVHDVLADVIPKVEFGSQVMQFLVWLQQFHRSSGLPVQTEQDACLQEVRTDQAALERELEVDHGNADELDVMRARLLMTAKFLEKVSESLETECRGTGTGTSYTFCTGPRCYRQTPVSVTVTTLTEINKTEKPMLSFGIGRLLADMNSAFTGQTQLAGNIPACASAKRQKTS